jgi:hypothetical protein
VKMNSLNCSDNNENHYINMFFSYCNLGLQFEVLV